MGRASTSRDLDGGRYEQMTLLTVMTYSPVGRLRRFTSTLYKGSVKGKFRVIYGEVPNPCYNEYICYHAMYGTAHLAL